MSLPTSFGVRRLDAERGGRTALATPRRQGAVVKAVPGHQVPALHATLASGRGRATLVPHPPPPGAILPAMNTGFSLLLMLCTSAWSHAADDIRSKVFDAARAARESSRTIHPDKAIYGIAFGTSEDEFIQAHGKPTGYV